MLESYAGRVATGKPEYEEENVFCSSLLSNFRAHFTRVKQVGQVGRSLPPLPYRRLGGRREQLTERDREHSLA